MRDQSKPIVPPGIGHAGGLENIFAHVVDVLFRGSSLDGATDQRESLGGVVELRPRFVDQGIVGKELKAACDRIVKVVGIVELDVVERAGTVVTNTAQVAQ